jgi:uncharacterized protein (TIGR03083 family)
MTAPDHAELLGAWALDAVEPAQREAVDAAVRTDPVLRAQGDELRHVVALLGEDVATAPPPSVRQAVLDDVRARGRGRSIDPSSPTEAYVHQAADTAAAFTSVPDDAWSRQASPYEWSLHGLVAHLLQVERYFERTLGVAQGPAQPGEVDHLQLGAAEIEAELQRPPRETLDDWRATVARISARLGELDLDRSVTFHQWPFSLRSLFVARAFELWTHADDTRRALGQGVVAPHAADAAVMSDTSVRSLSLAIHVVSQHVPDGSARVVLTGDGGGTWDLQLGAGGGELVTIVADVVDYCRLAARRFEPETIPATIDGDRAVALDLLRAATIIAV